MGPTGKPIRQRGALRGERTPEHSSVTRCRSAESRRTPDISSIPYMSTGPREASSARVVPEFCGRQPANEFAWHERERMNARMPAARIYAPYDLPCEFIRRTLCHNFQAHPSARIPEEYDVIAMPRLQHPPSRAPELAALPRMQSL